MYVVWCMVEKRIEIDIERATDGVCGWKRENCDLQAHHCWVTAPSKQMYCGMIVSNDEWYWLNVNGSTNSHYWNGSSDKGEVVHHIVATQSTSIHTKILVFFVVVEKTTTAHLNLVFCLSVIVFNWSQNRGQIQLFFFFFSLIYNSFFSFFFIWIWYWKILQVKLMAKRRWTTTGVFFHSFLHAHFIFHVNLIWLGKIWQQRACMHTYRMKLCVWRIDRLYVTFIFILHSLE